MPLSDAILLVIFSIVLYSSDVYSDMALSIQLYMNKYYKFSYLTLGPIVASLIFLIPHWWRIEYNWQKRFTTFPLLLIQCWPQYQACKIIYFGLVKKTSTWRTEKVKMEKDVTSIGKFFLSSILSIYVWCILEPFIEALPQIIVLSPIASILRQEPNNVIGDGAILFKLTFLSSILSAGFGMTKFLKLGPCRLISSFGLASGYFKLTFFIIMVNVICTIRVIGSSLSAILYKIFEDSSFSLTDLYLDIIFLAFLTKVSFVSDNFHNIPMFKLKVSSP